MINIFAERRSVVALSQDEHPVEKLVLWDIDPATRMRARSG
jgi:hypothetical protein